MTETESTAQAVAARMSAITDRLRSALNEAEFPEFNDCVSAEAVRAAIRSFEALRSDILTGVEIVPADVPNSGLTMALVVKTVSGVFGVPPSDIITPKRMTKINTPPYRASIRLIRKHIPYKSNFDIARFMRKKDHSTIHHADKMAIFELNRDVEFAHLVGVAEQKLIRHA